MQFKTAFFAFLVATFQIVYTQDYCRQSLCGSKKHIACNNNGQFASTCRKARMVPITQKIKNVIINQHNKRRNLVAGGSTGLSPACRMATMQWDNELASLAALNVKQCKMQHDACRNTDAFKNSGQNLALIGFNKQLVVPKQTRKAINMFYKEIKNTNMAQINNFPSNYGGPPIGHFTVMVADRNNRVGCAISTFKQPGKRFRTFLMACNYASTNIINAPIYASCPTAASGCRTGKSAVYPNLCSVSETYV